MGIDLRGRARVLVLILLLHWCFFSFGIENLLVYLLPHAWPAKSLLLWRSFYAISHIVPYRASSRDRLTRTSSRDQLTRSTSRDQLSSATSREQLHHAAGGAAEGRTSRRNASRDRSSREGSVSRDTLDGRINSIGECVKMVYRDTKMCIFLGLGACL